MPMKPDEINELKTLLAAARKKPLNFGLCIGKKPDTMIFYLHRKKSPEILARLAKKAGDTAKVAMGTVSISGKKMQLTIVGDVPSGLAKRTKVFLTAKKMPFNVELLDASGNLLESDGDEDGQDAPQDESHNTGGTADVGPSEPIDTTPEVDTQAPPPVDKAGYKTARDAARKELGRIAKLKVDLSALKTDLANAEKLMKEKPPRDQEAIKLIADMAPKFAKASKEYCDRKKKEAKDAIDLVKTYFGMALEIPKLEAVYVALETECGKTPADFKKVSAMARSIVRKETALKKLSKKYKTEYDRVEAEIVRLCDNQLRFIADPMLSSERADIIRQIAVAREKLNEHSPVLAEKLANKVASQISDLWKVLKERKAYTALKTATDLELAKLDTARNGGVEQECKGFEADQVKAKAFVDKRSYYDATLLIKPIAALIPPLLKIAADYKTYVSSARIAAKGLMSIGKNPQFEFVIPEYKELQAKFKAADAVAKKKEYKKALNQMLELLKAIPKVIAKADKAAALKEFENGIDNADVDILRQQAKDILAALKSHPRAKLAPLLLADVEKHVLELESLWNQLVDSSARKELKIISELANEARKKLDTVDAYFNRAERLGSDTGKLAVSHSQAGYIRPFLSKISALVNAVKKDAIESKPDLAKKLASGEKLLLLAKSTGDAEEKYRVRRTDLEVKITAITAAEFEFADKVKILADIAVHMGAAEEASKAFKHDIAEKAIVAAETLVMTAHIGASAKTGAPPSKDDIKKLLAQPDGQKTLDALVAALPGSTQQDVMINVLEARFGMKVNVYTTLSKEDQDQAKSGGSLNVPAPNLMAYYEMLKSLPASHTTLNPSLARFDQVEEDDASWYEPGNDTVVMTMDNAMTSPNNPVGDPNELDNIDPDSVSPALAVEPTYGSWTTFHEIGHAVDDRQSFMTKNGKNDAYGGWVEYGSNVGPIAKAASIHFDFDRNFIERKMAGGKPKPPEIPAELKTSEGRNAQKVWTKRQKDFEVWHKGVSVKSKPWNSASAVNTLNINGVMYHEAYAGTWVSYKADARKKGLTGYQFRAPGEWFSELYAAFHTKKLSNTHPARAWLATL